MENKIIVTTTNTIENAEIEKYIDLISTNVVVGTNLFSDFGASLTDLFGGFSDSYQGKLQKIYSMAIDNLKMKAANIGANTILGLKVDFDEISGKGKSMFMISALGTAVIVKYNQNKLSVESEKKSTIILNEKLEQEITKRNIITTFKNNELPSQDEWIYLLNNPIEEIAEQLIDLYLNRYTSVIESGTDTQLLLSNTTNFFNSLKKETAIEILYKKLYKNPILILKIIKANNLFSSSKIIELIQNENMDLAIECLDTNMDFYSEEDLASMNKIINLLNNLPNKGKIENVKAILGKTKEKYICPNGHTNDVESEFCTFYTCGENIKGLTVRQFNDIEEFSIKVDSLFTLMSSN